MLWVWILLRRGVLDTTLCDKVCQWLTAGKWFSPGTLISSINKTDRHDITEILLKVALNTINQTNHQCMSQLFTINVYIVHTKTDKWKGYSKFTVQQVIVTYCQGSNLSATTWRGEVTFWWDGNIYLDLDQNTELNFDSGSSLTQQSMVRHVTTLTMSQPVFAPTP